MISSQHLSNNGKNWHANVLNKGKKILLRFKLSS